MPTDLPIECRCGALRGTLRDISPRRGNRLVCYCNDCQSFAHFLGNADEILDTHGGTDIFQTSPARLEFTQGAEALACVRLRKGGLLRWYAACCNTPVGNTMASSGAPFVGLIHGGLTGSERELALGPIRGGVQAGSAKGDRASLDAYDRALNPLMFRFLRVLLAARLRGDHRRSPFFDPESGARRAKPKVLSEEELRAVETARDALVPAGGAA